MKISGVHHVALVDSGIGGFSIMGAIEDKLPGIGISYFMDNLYLPYGELSEPQLLERLERIVEFLQTEAQPDLIVIACNTASTQSLDFLRQRFEQIFVGVVPAIKPAAQLSLNKRIGLLATPATVQSRYTDELVASFAKDCEVTRVGSSELVHWAEQWFWQENSSDLPCLPSLAEVDTVVLGCTHFPMIRELIRQSLPQEVTLVDSGAAIANRVASLLQQNHGKSEGKRLYASKALPQERQSILTQMGFESVSVVDV